MARETTKWPSTRWPITKIMSSDGCNGNRVPLEMGPWYDFREFVRVSVLLCMTDLAHASKLKEHDDNDDFQGTTGRAA